jgi:hypothetical protein
MPIRVSSFHKLLAERSQQGLNLDTPEIKKVNDTRPIEGRVENNRSFSIETKTENHINFVENRRNFSFNQKSLGENRNENRKNLSENPRRYSDKKEEKVEEKPVLTEMDFPELEIKETKSPVSTVKTDYKKLLDDVVGLREGTEKMNLEIIENGEKDKKERILVEIAIIQEKEKERRRWDYIKKIKKQYENDYVTYSPDDYLEHEMLYYVDEEELSQDEELALYEEMLLETKNRDVILETELLDSEKYYTVYDEESKYYELEEELKK